VTARISADSSVHASGPVAASIVKGLASGTFLITCELDGWLISQATAGFAPAQSTLQALASVLLAGIIRAASFVYLFR
jgi:3-dehydrosphinganine reductase